MKNKKYKVLKINCHACSGIGTMTYPYGDDDYITDDCFLCEGTGKLTKLKGK